MARNQNATLVDIDEVAGALAATDCTTQSLNGVGAGRYRPAPYRDSDPPDPSAGIECFTVTDDEKSTVSPSAERPKGLSIRWFGAAMRADGSSRRFSFFFLGLGQAIAELITRAESVIRMQR